MRIIDTKKAGIYIILTFILSTVLAFTHVAFADTICLVSPTLSNPDYHHGLLHPVKGVHNIQVMRANREIPDSAGGFNWTYSHGPNMVYWNHSFYIQYISNPVHEHVPPGRVMITNSKDGYHWKKPEILFPPYKIPDGTTKEGVKETAKDLYSVTHQRMGFYISKNGKLLTLGYYGICIGEKDSPNDGNGLGRVVREIHKDGSFGPVFFIRYNHNWNDKNTDYPFYQTSEDKAFVAACEELLSNPLMMQQWVEEADRNDPLISLQKQYKAFSYYHLPDGRVIGLWKYALTSISEDNGKTWLYEPTRAPGFINKNAKIWGQQTSDGNYAIVYNPSQFRWPLAISTSHDGIKYENLLLINGEISTMRYGGQYKSYGPQYVRGILEGNGTPPDKNLWITYSMNKEDIWVSKIPVPITDKEEKEVLDVFSEMENGKELDNWNIFSPLWAPVYIENINEIKWLTLSDWDRYDYAIAERIIPVSSNASVEFTVKAGQNNLGILHIELQDGQGKPGIRLILNEQGEITCKDGYNFVRLINYEAKREYKIRIDFNVRKNFFEVFVDDQKKTGRNFFTPLPDIERIVFRTGEKRYYPTPDSPSQQDFDLEKGGIPAEKTTYYIKDLRVVPLH